MLLQAVLFWGLSEYVFASIYIFKEIWIICDTDYMYEKL